jgi:hypothetical protein
MIFIFTSIFPSQEPKDPYRNRSFAMPPSRRKKRAQGAAELAQVEKERQERKERQEKIRKRPPSLFRKAKILATDTDAWVNLTVLYASGKCDTFTSSDDPNWPNQDMRVSQHFS